MTSDRRGFTPDELALVLKQLDEVLDEAERVRREVTRQLSQQRSNEQLADAGRKRPKRKTF